MDTHYSAADFGIEDFEALESPAQAAAPPAQANEPAAPSAQANEAVATLADGAAAEPRQCGLAALSSGSIGASAPMEPSAIRVLIIADARERHGAIPFLEAAVENNNHHHRSYSSRAAGAGMIGYEVRTIHAGDYSFLMNGRTVAVAERKTWADLSATISDGRAAGQHENMMRLRREGVHTFYIIEGRFNYSPDTIIGNKPHSTLATRLRRDMIRGIPHVQTGSAAETAAWLVNFARDLLFVHVPHPEPTPFETALLELCAAHPGEAIAQHLVGILGPRAIGGSGDGAVLPSNIFKKHEPSLLVQIESVWAAIPSVSAATAAAFRHEFTFHDFFNLPHDTIINRVAAMQYAGGGHIGRPRAAKICEIAYRGDDLFRAAAAATAQLKFLGSIPGVTEVRARAILAVATIADMCAGRVPVATLADAQVGGRRLGTAIVERLFGLLQHGANVTQVADPPRPKRSKAAAETTTDEPAEATSAKPKRAAKPKAAVSESGDAESIPVAKPKRAAKPKAAAAAETDGEEIDAPAVKPKPRPARGRWAAKH